MNKKLLLLIPLLTLLLSFSFTFSQTGKELTADVSPFDTKPSQNLNAPKALWDILANYNADVLTGVLQNYGVVFTGTNYIISVFNSATMYKLDADGNSLGSFTITGSTLPSSQGFRDMEYANGFLWGGANSNVIYKIDLTTNTQVGTITLPSGVTARGLAYDPIRDGFWSSAFGGNITCYSATTGAAITGAVLSNSDAGKHGLAYDDRSAGGPFLWVSVENSTATGYKMVKYNLTTLALVEEYNVTIPDILPGTGSTTLAPGGLDVRDNLVQGKLVAISLCQGDPDRITLFELANLDAGVLAPFNITSPTAGAVIESFPNSATEVTITWDTSRAGASYKWIFGSPTVPPRSFTMPSGTNQLTFTLGEIDELLADAGLLPGQELVGQWDVWAFRNNMPDNDSLKAANGPRAITLKRGVPQLVAFNLANPANNSTITTSVFNNNPVVINWNGSGEGVTYRWKFGTGIAKSQGVMLNLPSNNGGFDTNLTIINSALDLTLAGLGVEPGGSIVGQWTVYAYSGIDSLKAVETFNLTLTRQAKGDVLVAYDSSSTNARISRDSVLSYLNLRNITFDLFNKGTNTSTNSMTFRGYQRIIWLGEGTNIMSIIQKDSLKAYLNNPAETKSKLIIFGEDVGYSLGRSASTYYDLDFVNNYLGFNFVLDRPPSGAAQRLKWIHYVPEFYDSTIGSWPDVLTVFDPINGHHLIQFTDGTYNATGKVAPMNNVVVFGLDIESLRRAFDSPVGPTHHRFLDYAIMYVDNDGIIPVELLSFNASISGNLITLNWVTATEMNNCGFEVQRKINDGSFETIAFIEGKGTTMEQQNYIFTDKASVAGNYSYRLKQVDFDGSFEITDAVEVDFTAPVDFSLNQNYPNPFNPTTIINFGLAVDANVSIKIYNTLGQEVTTLLNGEMKAGLHDVEFNASSFSSGVYFYQIEAQGVNGTNFSSVKKMMLMK